jgi:hypothetical protein
MAIFFDHTLWSSSGHYKNVRGYYVLIIEISIYKIVEGRTRRRRGMEVKAPAASNPELSRLSGLRH